MFFVTQKKHKAATTRRRRGRRERMITSVETLRVSVCDDRKEVWSVKCKIEYLFD